MHRDLQRANHSYDGQQWYRAYCTAMLPSDDSTALDHIAKAQAVIEKRMAEIHRGRLANGREPQDLKDALKFLGILLRHSEATCNAGQV